MGLTREPALPRLDAPGIQIGGDGVTVSVDGPQWKVLRFGTVVPATTRWSDLVPARVKIDETHASRVGAPLAGRITQVFVDLGQPVKMGDPLFTVASPDIAGLRAEREKSLVDVEVARGTLERVKAMVATHAVAAREEIEADQAYRQASLSLRLAQNKLAALQISSRADNEVTVVSPRDGIVVEKNLLPGQQVSGGSTLVDVADLSQIWIVAELFEADAVGIHVGTRAKISSPSMPDLALESQVDIVSSVVDPTRHTIPVRVRLDNAKGLLRPNIFAQMRFAVEPPPGSGEVTASSLVSDGAKQYVYVQTDRGHLIRREVVAGAVREGKMPILSGLAPGQIVVEEGAILLENQVTISR
ncbi:MAG: efflux RND transporter periplasmic adaptor subunit [Byssovorax sp.]